MQAQPLPADECHLEHPRLMPLPNLPNGLSSNAFQQPRSQVHP